MSITTTSPDPQTPIRPSILVVDDDPEVGKIVIRTIAQMNSDCTISLNGTEFRTEYLRTEYTLVILDMHLPDTDGIELLRFISSQIHRARILIVSGKDLRFINAAVNVALALGLDVVGHFQKPLPIRALRSVIAKALSEGSPPRESSGSPFGDLHRAIQTNELRLLYQPKIDMKTRRLAGAEALIRWEHATRGLLGAMEFIPLAERNGLIVPLTRWVLTNAIRHIALWRSNGADFAVSINVPGACLNDIEFPNLVFELLEFYEVPGTSLCIEITESGATQDIVTATDVLTRLGIRGIALSIDDFGTGYSSLMKLHQLPFTELKIDKTFVLGINDSEESKVIPETIINLARNLKMVSTAEGVETPLLWDHLERMNCDLAQGYFIAGPMDVESFNRWMDNWK